MEEQRSEKTTNQVAKEKNRSLYDNTRQMCNIRRINAFDRKRKSKMNENSTRWMLHQVALWWLDYSMVVSMKCSENKHREKQLHQNKAKKENKHLRILKLLVEVENNEKMNVINWFETDLSNVVSNNIDFELKEWHGSASVILFSFAFTSE